MYQSYTKRLLDITFASAIIIIASPALGLGALAVRLGSRGPIIFKQKRYGKNNTVFTIYKFRTMSLDAPSNHATNSLKNPEQYITRSGKIMRKLSVDELPQLFNVLKGEMSMVGPRPVILKETDLIAEREKHNANWVKPGITGWAQVNGRDEVRVEEKARMDGEYAENLGLIMDAKCVVKTVWAVLSVKGHREGAVEDPAIAREKETVSGLS